MYKFLLLLTLLSVNGYSQSLPQLSGIAQPKRDTLSKPLLRLLADKQLVADPENIMPPQAALQATRKVVQQRLNNFLAVPGVTWVERGPNNIGGRTRALMFDPTDNTNKKVWAGGVGGGLWFTNDITNAAESWTKVDDFWDNIAISAIVAHPDKPATFYVGTGEGYYNVDAAAGGGIWKTTDAGVTWQHLSSTTPDFTGVQPIGTAFKYVQDLEVLTTGQVLAATRSGILRSSDGGSTWTIVLNGVNVGDLERGTDDVLFAGARPGKIYKSTDKGITWTDITPASVSGGARTEIGIAPSTNGAAQVLYAATDGGTAVGWLIKSTDGGATWNLLSGYSNFIGSQGWYDFILKVHPANPNLLICGGTNFTRTTDGGSTWSAFAYWSHGHPDMHEVIFRPGSPNEAIYGCDGGIFYATDFGDATAAFPTDNYIDRNTDYNVTQYYSVAQKNISDESYFIGGTQDNGTHKITTAGIGNATMIMGGDGMLSFIDQDEPNIQIGSYQWNNYLLLDENGVSVSFLISDGDGSFINPADYDWKNNILYTYKNPTQIVKVTDVGGSNQKTYITLPTSISIGVLKVAYAPNTLFCSVGNTIYKLTNLNTTPAVTSITTGSNIIGTISCIELGATDDELLVTVASYNQKSVFYTNNGGQTWISKDEPAYGLPNFPVRYALFNPKNRNQVLLATELGVWSSNNFYSSNPGWEMSSDNLARVRCDMLRYRNSDGQVAVGTHGRGIFTTNVFQSDIIPAISITSPLETDYCSGDPLKVAFTAAGTFASNNEFRLQLSDENGSFTSPSQLTTTTNSPFPLIFLPDTLKANGNYRLRVIATNEAIIGDTVSFLAKGMTVENAVNLPNAGYSTENTFTFNTQVNKDAQMAYTIVSSEGNDLNMKQVIAGVNTAGFPAIKSGQLLLNPNEYTGTLVYGMLPGRSYDVFSVTKDPATGCFSTNIFKSAVQTTGTPLSYAPPVYTSGCATYRVLINQFSVNGTLYSSQNNCSNASSFDDKKSAAIPLTAGVSNTLYVNLTFNGGYYYGQGVAVWVDSDHSGAFESGELLYTSPSSSGYGYNGSFIIPVTAKQGLTKLRIRSSYHEIPSGPTVTLTYGEAEDHLVFIENPTANPQVYSNINVDSVNINEGLKLYFATLGPIANENTFSVELSDSTGSFANPTVLLSNYAGASPALLTVPSNLPAGENYILRLVATNPAVTGNESYPFRIVNNCNDISNLQATHYADLTETLKANQRINASSSITGTSRITFRSQSIELQPGFAAENGTVFMTEIGGCNN